MAHPPSAAPAPGRLETRDGAYELKFLLRETQVDGVIDWAQAHLRPDPHAAAAADACYAIHSVYLDTPELAVYHREPRFRRRKYRLRRYAEEGTVYLEEKRKRSGWVTKVRTGVAAAELELLATPEDPGEWAGAWFRQAMEEHRLRPVCQVAYRRLAREGETEGAPVRLTVDREIRSARAAGLCPAWQQEPQRPIPLTVLELKFRQGLPRLFKELIRTFGLTAAAESKYRRAADACALGKRG